MMFNFNEEKNFLSLDVKKKSTVGLKGILKIKGDQLLWLLLELYKMKILVF